jgi:carboxyl-terminal processing protease
MIERARWRTQLVVLLLAAVMAPALARGQPSERAEAATEAAIVRLTASLLASSQLTHRTLDGTLASDFLDRYVEALDPQRMLFLESDLAEFGPHRATLARDTRRTGSSALAHVIFERFVTRLREHADYVRETLRSARFSFDGDDVYSLDREGAPYPRDGTAARALWRARLRADYLQEKLQDKTAEQIGDTLTRRAARRLRDIEQMSRSQVLEVYLSALARVYDPHSDYLGHEQMENLAISMNLSLFGIGARLRSVDGRCEVVDLVPGGPAIRSGRLGAGDQIVAVTQDGEAPVDVVGMSLRRIVAMIRGPKGTVVHLTVIPGDDEAGTRETVRLVRDKIKLEEQRARASVVDLPTDTAETRRLGVLSLPSFYADLAGERGAAQGRGTSVTDDVHTLLGRLAREKVHGIVLDLRRNSGGSLREAIRLTGLFIAEGPIVQTRSLQGAVNVAIDPDPALVYGGPLVVLTSRVSASASEILAGALQDYGRAVIVGDASTFGKGTVQSIMPLARFMDRAGLEYAYDPGSLKVTVSKFYRPAGASTQLKGIASDIVLPSTIGARSIGEVELDNPLPWDAVPPAGFEPVGDVTRFLGTLRARSAQRVARRKDFAFLHRDVDRVRVGQAKRTVSLNEPARRAEIDRLEARRAEFRAAMAELPEARPVIRAITVGDAGKAGSPPSSAADAAPSAASARGIRSAAGADHPLVDDDAPARDIVLHEAQRILADLISLQRQERMSKEEPAAAAVTPHIH